MVLDCQEYVGGLARVVQHVLELTSCDILLWGGLYVQGVGPKRSKRLVLIGVCVSPSFLPCLPAAIEAIPTRG